MTVEQFNELVRKYSTNGIKEVEGYPQRVQDAVIECWERIESELDEDDENYEEMVNRYISGHWLDTLYYINYAEKSIDGYYTGVGGMVDNDNRGIAMSQEFALSFETEEEALEWIEEHKDEWTYGDLSVN